MSSKPVSNPRYDDAFLVRLRIIATAEEWCEKTGHPMREAWRRIAFYTRKQLIKPFPSVRSFEDFRERHREEIAQYRAAGRVVNKDFFRKPDQNNGILRETVEDAGWRIVDYDTPTDGPHKLEAQDFIRRTVKTLRTMLHQDKAALSRLLYDYARLLADVRPDRRSRVFRWAVYRDIYDDSTTEMD